MSGDASQRLFNTQERATSSDINRTRNILQFNIQEVMAALATQDTSGAGVIDGLTVSITDVGVNKELTVAVGYGFLGDTGFTYPDSQNRVIELVSSVTVDISAQADVTNPRWLVVEIAPGITAPVQESVDIFNPVSNTFASATRDKEIRPEPVITIRAGTAAVDPALPAGIAAVMPLAYIFVPANFTGFAAGHIISCRPLAGPVLPRPLQFGDSFKSLPVQGGGVSVAGASTTLAEMQPMSGQFLEHRDAFSFSLSTVLDLGDVFGRDDTTLGGSLPVTDNVTYWYAHEVPYPTGYSGLAKREFDVGTDAISEVPGVETDQTGCIILASLALPDRNTAQGSPDADLVNNAAIFGGSRTIAQKDAFYIGATDYRGSTGFLSQQFGRAARVLPGADDRQSRIDISSTGTLNLWVPAGAADGFALRLPITAFEIFIQVTAQVDDTGPNSVRYAFDDNTNRNVQYKLDHQEGETGAHEVSQQSTLYVSSSGDVSLANRDAIGSPSSEFLYNRAYTDIILLRR